MIKQKVLTEHRLNTSDSLIKNNLDLIFCSSCNNVLMANMKVKGC